MLKPLDLFEAFDLAKHIETAIDNQCKRQRSNVKSVSQTNINFSKANLVKERVPEQKPVNGNQNNKNAL